MTLAFRDLSYSVTLPKGQGEKQILSNVSGMFRPGRVAAIMGPSGAGKTSLLDLLAGRVSVSSGQLWLGRGDHGASGGQPGAGGVATPAQVRRAAAYVQQDDSIMASMTVREALLMAVTLTLGGDDGHGAEKPDARTERLLRTFRLEGCADTQVGDPNGRAKGISGGERKRCAVAMCAVAEPPVLFLDEPTSGLDAHKVGGEIRRRGGSLPSMC